jgi:hypothetical protein
MILLRYFSRFAIIPPISGLSPCFSLPMFPLIFDLSRAYPRHLTLRQSYMGLTIRCVWRHASVVQEGLLCLRGHAVHHREEYPPASWRVAVHQVIRNKYIANKQKCVRCGQHSNDHRRHRRTRLRHPYQYASPADDGHRGVPQ